VPDGPPHTLAGHPLSLPIVPAHRIRLSTTGGKAGVRLSYRPAADRPPRRAAVGCRCPPRGVSRLAMRGHCLGSRAQFLGEGYDSPLGVPPPCREADARQVLPPL